MKWKVEVKLRPINGVIDQNHSLRAAAITPCRYVSWHPPAILHCTGVYHGVQLQLHRAGTHRGIHLQYYIVQVCIVASSCNYTVQVSTRVDQ